MKTLVRIVLASIAYVAGCVITGVIAPFVHLAPLHTPPGVEPSKMFLALVASTPLLAIGVLPLASGLAGSWWKRWLSLSALIYVTIGLNTMIEAKIFTTVVEGSAFAASLFSLLPCVLVAAVFATSNAGLSAEKSRITTNAGSWTWRLLVAWLSFPVIYWTFGMCVAPFVMAYYNNTTMGLRIPSPGVIVGTQLVRSMLLLAATLPATLLWTKSQRQYMVSMGLAHAFAIGIFQLASAIFMAPRLRILHSLEITADSFAYAAVLGVLFIAGASVTRDRAPVEKAEPELAETAVGSR